MLKIRRIDETTTSGNVVFMPGGSGNGGDIRRIIAGLIKDKTEWGIELWEDGERYHLLFEDALGIDIAKEHLGIFDSEILKIRGVHRVSLKGLLNEAILDEFDSLLEILITELKELPEVQRNLVLLRSFYSVFGGLNRVGVKETVLFDLVALSKSIDIFKRRVRKEYSGDTGYLERAVSAVQDKLSLSSLGIFREYDYLVGCSVEVKMEDVVVRLDLRTNMTSRNSQLLTISDQEVLEDLDAYKGVKVLGNTIQPITEFTPSFFINIKNAVKGRDFDGKE